MFIDGGFRSGVDVFKALALGADGVLIGRPYAVAAYGGGIEGVETYTNKIKQELVDTMRMTGCGKLTKINKNKIYEDKIISTNNSTVFQTAVLT